MSNQNLSIELNCQINFWNLIMLQFWQDYVRLFGPALSYFKLDTNSRSLISFTSRQNWVQAVPESSKVPIIPFTSSCLGSAQKPPINLFTDRFSVERSSQVGCKLSRRHRKFRSIFLQAVVWEMRRKFLSIFLRTYLASNVPSSQKWV